MLYAVGYGYMLHVEIDELTVCVTSDVHLYASIVFEILLTSLMPMGPHFRRSQFEAPFMVVSLFFFSIRFMFYSFRIRIVFPFGSIRFDLYWMRNKNSIKMNETN